MDTDRLNLDGYETFWSSRVGEESGNIKIGFEVVVDIAMSDVDLTRLQIKVHK
jgi:hypothetical protein